MNVQVAEPFQSTLNSFAAALADAEKSETDFVARVWQRIGDQKAILAPLTSEWESLSDAQYLLMFPDRFEALATERGWKIYFICTWPVSLSCSYCNQAPSEYLVENGAWKVCANCLATCTHCGVLRGHSDNCPHHPENIQIEESARAEDRQWEKEMWRGFDQGASTKHDRCRHGVKDGDGCCSPAAGGEDDLEMERRRG